MKVKPFAAVCKVVASFLSCLKTLSIGPAPEITPATSHSAAKHSTDIDNLLRFLKTVPCFLDPIFVQCSSFFYNITDLSIFHNNCWLLSSGPSQPA